MRVSGFSPFITALRALRNVVAGDLGGIYARFIYKNKICLHCPAYTYICKYKKKIIEEMVGILIGFFIGNNKISHSNFFIFRD